MRRWLLRSVLLGAVTLAGAGCAPLTWGGTYNVLNANSSQIVIEYDRALTNPSLLMPVVNEHCQKHGKEPHLIEVRRGFGLGMIHFECR